MSVIQLNTPPHWPPNAPAPAQNCWLSSAKWSVTPETRE
jgi:hypothetical protein